MLHKHGRGIFWGRCWSLGPKSVFDQMAAPVPEIWMAHCINKKTLSIWNMRNGRFRKGYWRLGDNGQRCKQRTNKGGNSRRAPLNRPILWNVTTSIQIHKQNCHNSDSRSKTEGWTNMAFDKNVSKVSSADTAKTNSFV
jgi:hypothetical protein